MKRMYYVIKRKRMSTVKKNVNSEKETIWLTDSISTKLFCTSKFQDL